LESPRLATLIRDKKHQYRTRLRRWSMLLFAWTVIPLLLLGACEGLLRFGGYGEPLAPFTVLHAARGRAYVCNYNYLYSMFTRMPDTAKTEAQFAIPEVKESGTYRIFVFGSSAAFGWIHNTSFAQMLQIMLMDRFPGVRFEVYNLANGGLNSSLMRPLAVECAHMQPDAYVIYMGNNEVHGPYGLVSEWAVRPGRVLTPLEIRMQLKMREFRLGQLMTAMMNREKADSPVEHVPEELRPDDPRLEQVWRNYQSNMQSMFRSARTAGAKVFISTLGANLRHWPPQPGLSWKGLGEEDRNRVARLMEEGKAAESAGDWDQAMASYRQAGLVDDANPYLLFRIANCLWALQAYDEARACYAQALELDSFCWVRAKRAFNDTIRRAVATDGRDDVFLIEGQKKFEEAAPHGTPGNESFADGCHMRPAGMYVLAKGFFEQMAAQMPEWVRKHESSGAAVPGLDDILALLGSSEALQEETLERLVQESRKHGVESADALQAELERIRANPVTVDYVLQLRLTQKIIESGTEDIQFAHRFLECLGRLPGTFTGDVPALLERLSERYYFDKLFQHNYLDLLSTADRSEEREIVCRRLLEIYPGDDLAYLHLAAILRAREDRASLAGLYEQAQRLGAAKPTCRYLQGSMLLLEGNPAAITTFCAALEKDAPAYAFASEGLRDSLRRFAGTPEARAALDAYLEIVAQDPEAHLSPERVEEMFDAWSLQADSAQFWQDCAQTRPDAVFCWLFSGMALEREGRYPEARAAYEKAVALYPENRAIRYRIASLEILHGNLEEGLSHLDYMASRNHQESVSISEMCANVAGQFQKGGNLRAAVRLYEKALEISPANLWARVYLGETYASLGDTDAAKDAYRQVLSVAPESPHTAALLQELMDKTDPPGTAEAFWTALLETRPEAVIPRLYLGRVLEQADRGAEARSAYGKVLELSPDSAEAGFRLAALDILDGKVDSGLEAIKGVATKDPSLTSDISKRLQEIADAFRHRKDPDTALRLYQAALDISPSDLWPRVCMGELHEEQGNNTAALDAYRAVLAEKPESPVTAGKMQALLLKLQAPPETVLAEWKALAEQHPGAAVPLYYLAGALDATGEPGGAGDARRRALEINPEIENVVSAAISGAP